MRRHSKSPPASALAARPPTTSPEILQRAPTRACRHNEHRIDIRTLRHGRRQPRPKSCNVHRQGRVGTTDTASTSALYGTATDNPRPKPCNVHRQRRVGTTNTASTSALAARPPITLARNLATCTDKGVSAQPPVTAPDAPTTQKAGIRPVLPPRRPWRPLPRSRAPSQTDEKCRYGRRSPRCKRYGRSVSLPPSEFSLDRRSVSRCEKSDRPHATPPTRDVLPVRRNGERPQPHAGRHRHRSPLRRRHRQTPRRKHPPVRPTKDEGAKAPSSKPSVSGRPSRRPAPTAGSQNLSPMPNVGVPQLIPA